MLTISEMQETINSAEISDKHFLNLHIVIESYIKRLVLIGLRNKGSQYKVAKNCVNKFYVQPSEMMKTVWRLLDISNKELEEDKAYTPINNCHLNFTSVYRNERLHGVISEIQDEKLLELLIKLDKAYINSLEKTCQRLRKASCFDPPKKWGISRKGVIIDEDEVMEKLLKNKKKTKKMSRDEAEKIVQKLKL